MIRVPLIALIALTLSAAAQDKPQAVEQLVTIQQGTLPIIISAPHGGRTAITGVPERRGAGVNQFVVVRDDNTAELAVKLAGQIEKRFGGKPYLVVAKFERKYLDVNRPAEAAYESDKAKPIYDAYHKALKDATKDIQRDWGRGLLLDIHGQGADKDAIFRGTGDGKTVKALTDRFGKSAVTGEKGLFGQLRKQGFKVVPANDSMDKEDRRYNGGHIVRTYGSHDGNAIDAMQLELGGSLRARVKLDDTANGIADAVAGFAKEYLPKEKVKR